MDEAGDAFVGRQAERGRDGGVVGHPAGQPLRTEAQRLRVCLTDPVDYPALITLLERCHLTLTDSGGIQEEASALARPVLADGSFGSFDLAAFRYGVGMMALLPFAWAARATLLRLGLKRILLLALFPFFLTKASICSPMLLSI